MIFHPNFYETGSSYGKSRTRKFTDIFDTADSFVSFYSDCGIPPIFSSDASARTLYYLLCSYYANSTIRSSDENRFKYNVMSIVYQHGGTWEKKVEIQKKLRDINLDSDTWLDGAKSVLNFSQNPATDPEADSFQTLDTINQQNMSLNRKGKLEGYSILIELLEENVTGAFLDKFKKLFRSIVAPQEPLIYDYPIINIPEDE